MAEWTVGADRGLKVVSHGEWDATAAKARIFKWAGWPDNPDPSKAKKAFLAYDASAPKLMGSYKFPFADVVNGTLVAVREGLAAAAGRLGQNTDVPAEVVKKMVAVKDKYFKNVHGSEKADYEGRVDFFIYKATLGVDGVRRWAATVSKFAADEQKDEVTQEFYRDAIEQVDKGLYPMPALVVSHYDDPRAEVATIPVPAEFRAGSTTSMYIDGNKPKAKGTFEDSPLGIASFNAVRKDIDDNVPDEQRTRISMAFRPAENGIEKSENGVTRYTKGMIRHFAMTRAPIVKETDLTLEKSDAIMVTRIEDATSIVGEELAAELDGHYKSIIVEKSEGDDVLIEKAGEQPEVVEEEMPLTEKALAEGEAELEKAKNGKPTPVGLCISHKMTGEGWDRKRAIAACLEMDRGGKLDASGKYIKGKSETENSDENPEVEKAMMNMDACMKELLAKGLTQTAAEAACKIQNKALLKMASALEPENSAAHELMPFDQCVKAYLDGGTTENEAIMKCGSAEARQLRARGAMKAATLDEVIDAAVSDGEVQVVKTSAAEGETVVNESTETAAPEPAESQNVNEPVEEKSGTESESPSEVDRLFGLFKSTISDPGLDRTEKTLVINHVFDELGKMAREMVEGNTPASTNDQAEVLKAALTEALGPIAAQLEQYRAENEALGMLLKTVAGAPAPKPTPKQLQFQGVQKSEAIEGDTGGALNASQIAAATLPRGVRY